VRGDVHRLNRPKGRVGHEQDGVRYAVVVQSDDLATSTVIVAPTSRSARAAIFRPTIEVSGSETQVLVEQLAAVDHTRLGPVVAHLNHTELREIEAALSLVLDLRVSGPTNSADTD